MAVVEDRAHKTRFFPQDREHVVDQADNWHVTPRRLGTQAHDERVSPSGRGVARWWRAVGSRVELLAWQTLITSRSL